MLKKPTNVRKCISLSYTMNAVFLLHVSATLVAILRKVHKRMDISRCHKNLWTSAQMWNR